MIQLPYPVWADVTPCKITIGSGGYDEDGLPLESLTWEGRVNFSEKAKRIQDKNGQWISLTAVIHVQGDILPKVVFTDASCKIEAYEKTMKCVAYQRPRNPDGSVHHTRLELI